MAKNIIRALTRVFFQSPAGTREGGSRHALSLSKSPPAPKSEVIRPGSGPKLEKVWLKVYGKTSEMCFSNVVVNLSLFLRNQEILTSLREKLNLQVLLVHDCKLAVICCGWVCWPRTNDIIVLLGTSLIWLRRVFPFNKWSFPKHSTSYSESALSSHAKSFWIASRCTWKEGGRLSFWDVWTRGMSAPDVVDCKPELTSRASG
jgi:hypothetical protein